MRNGLKRTLSYAKGVSETVTQYSAKSIGRVYGFAIKQVNAVRKLRVSYTEDVEIIHINNIDTPAQQIADTLIQAASQAKDVLWLLSGGSAISLAVRVSQLIPPTIQSVFTVGLADERFGEVGHNDSNWQQLKNAGFVFGAMQQQPILLPGITVDKATKNNASVFEKFVATNKPIIAILGIGADGHTAGILPHSPATRAGSDLVTHYQARPFERITITPAFFPHIDQVFLYAEGTAKTAVLERLIHKLDNVDEQPAQLITTTRHFFIYHKTDA